MRFSNFSFITTFILLFVCEVSKTVMTTQVNINRKHEFTYTAKIVKNNNKLSSKKIFLLIANRRNRWCN